MNNHLNLIFAKSLNALFNYLDSINITIIISLFITYFKPIHLLFLLFHHIVRAHFTNLKDFILTLILFIIIFAFFLLGR